MHRFSKAQRVGTAVTATGFAIAGSLHFIKPEPYIGIMPPWLPWHAQLVAVSGFFEIAGGLGLLIPTLQRAAAWGLAALLIAVFPANIYMAANPAGAGAPAIAPIFLWARLPLQFVLIWWVLWCTQSRPPR